MAIDAGWTRRLGWGVVGCGWVARDYGVPGIVASGNGRVAGLFDPDPHSMARLAATLPTDRGVAIPHDSLPSFLADPAVEAVYVATPNHAHAGIVAACAAAGKHVLCEKPMATTLADARRMVEACDRAGVVYATAYDQRFHAAHVRLRDLVADGTLGVVAQARIHYACWLPADWAPDNWRVDPARAGGGALIDLAPHGIDLLAMLLGDDWESLIALTQTRVHGYAVDDGAVLAGRFSGGALATLHVAYNCPDSFPRRRLELIGTRGMATATNTMGQTPGGTLEWVDAETGRSTAVPFGGAADRGPFGEQAGAFADAVLSGRPYPFSPASDLAHHALLEAACR
ncbi:Gfo/Idh/MocA family protein [Tundrisphaera sp. TA3]|uniref:Gfo/Idh/MocA family protein n=1 Tax=Tundrisphaera sp. TA3 TaxID=3435775 RepID=UPI003EBC9EC1